jgi:hypothetical protein
MFSNLTVDVVLPFTLLPFLVLLMGRAIGRFPAASRRAHPQTLGVVHCERAL